jgi:hypothetical protein
VWVVLGGRLLLTLPVAAVSQINDKGHSRSRASSREAEEVADMVELSVLVREATEAPTAGDGICTAAEHAGDGVSLGSSGCRMGCGGSRGMVRVRAGDGGWGGRHDNFFQCRDKIKFMNHK